MKPLSDYISLNEVEMDIGPNYFKAVVPVVPLKKSIDILRNERCMCDELLSICGSCERIEEIFGEKLTND